RYRQSDRLQDHVLCLCSAWASMRRALLAPAACTHGRSASECSAGAFTQSCLQTGGAVQPRCVCWWLCRPIAVGTVAFHSLRYVALGGKCILFLDKHSERVFLSGCRMALEALRPHQYDGLYSYPIERLSDCRRIFAELDLGPCVAAGEGRTFTDGCPN